MNTYNLFNDFAGGVQIDQALVNLELITIPGLRTFTTRLQSVAINTLSTVLPCGTYSLTSGNLQNFSGKADRSLDTKLLVLGPVYEITGD